MLAALKNAFLEGLALSKMNQESIELFISFFKLIDRHKFAGNIKSAIACFLLCVLEMAEFVKRCDRMLP